MLPPIICNMGVDNIFYENNWTNQINHFESINGYSTFKDSLKDLNKREYNEYMDLICRHNEQHIIESRSRSTRQSTQNSSKKYA